MQSENGATGTFKRQLPPDLLAVLQTKSPRKYAMPADLWQPSLIDRVLGLFIPRRAR